MDSDPQGRGTYYTLTSSSISQLFLMMLTMPGFMIWVCFCLLFPCWVSSQVQAPGKGGEAGSDGEDEVALGTVGFFICSSEMLY